MSDGYAGSPRRVGVISTPVVPQARGPVDGVPNLFAVLEILAERLRAGGVSSDLGAGVLADLTVDGVRCILLQQRPTVTVDLSPREQQIAVMVARGRTNQSIAGALEISAWTVSTHLRRIFAKLAVSSRAEMVAHLLGSPEYAAIVNPSDPARD